MYPPSVASPDPKAYTLELDLGAEGVLSANLTMVSTIVDAAPIYSRWGGSLVGAVGGGEELRGYGLWEQFKFV